VFSLIERWLKTAALEAQEYVYLVGRALRCAVTPPLYRHDIVEQLDVIGVGSMTVVLLSGLFTGAALALQSGQTLDQFGARPVVGRLVAASMIKELGPVLTIISDFVGILGGWVVARYTLQVNSGLYWSSVTKSLYMQDAWMGIIKPFVFGFIIVTVACHVGLRTRGGTAGVGKATTLSVVMGSVAVIAADFFVTQLLFFLIY